MGEGYPARTFQSGNSVALRLPAALGIKPGRHMTVRKDAEGRIIVEAGDTPAPRIAGGWIGTLPGLNDGGIGGRDIDERMLDWAGERSGHDDG